MKYEGVPGLGGAFFPSAVPYFPDSVGCFANHFANVNDFPEFPSFYVVSLHISKKLSGSAARFNFNFSLAASATRYI